MKDRNLVEFFSQRGVSIGEKRDSLQDLQMLFLQYGIVLHKGTFTQWRMNPEKGQQVMVRLQCAEMLRHGDATNLYGYYTKLIDAGLAARKPQKAWPWRYNSLGLSASITREMGIKINDTALLARSLRAEIVMEAAANPEIDNLLQQPAKNFFLAYGDQGASPPSMVVPSVDEIRQRWDGSTGSFYALFYETQKSGAAIGKFLAYELDFFKAYVDYQVARGSHLPQLAKQLLTIQAIADDPDGARDSLYIRKIVPVENSCLSTYISVVVDGEIR